LGELNGEGGGVRRSGVCHGSQLLGRCSKRQEAVSLGRPLLNVMYGLRRHVMDAAAAGTDLVGGCPRSPKSVWPLPAGDSREVGVRDEGRHTVDAAFLRLGAG
jgi:hypothetical protein